MGSLLDPAGLFDGGGGGILDPLDLFGKKKGGGGSIFDVIKQFAAAQQQPEAVDTTLMTPTVMPTADSDAQRAARRKSLASQARRRGRQSTILTAVDDSLGTAE